MITEIKIREEDGWWELWIDHKKTDCETLNDALYHLQEAISQDRLDDRTKTIEENK